MAKINKKSKGLGPKQLNQLTNAIRGLSTNKGRKTKSRAARPKVTRNLSYTSDEYEARRFAVMMSDPCHAPLAAYRPGTQGSTNIQRLRTTFTLHSTALNNGGTLLWFPEYHPTPNNPDFAGMSCFLGEYAAAGTAPFGTVGCINTTAVPFGRTTGAATSYTTFNSIVTPEAPQLASGIYRDCMTLGACINLRYLGTTSANAGVVNAIKNISPQMLFQTTPFLGVPTGATFPTTAQLLAYASDIARITPEGLELKWNNTHPAYRGLCSNFNGGATSANAPDGLVTNGNSTGPSQLGQYSDQSSGIGLCWRGLNSVTTSDIEIELVGVYEFRFAPTSGIIEQKPCLPPSESSVIRAQELMPNNWQFSRFANQAGAMVNDVLGGVDTLANTAGRVYGLATSPFGRALGGMLMSSRRRIGN